MKARQIARCLGDLDPRQIRLLRMAANGYTSRRMARQLRTSDGVVRIWMHELYRLLGVRNKAAAVALALRRGWIA